MVQRSLIELLMTLKESKENQLKGWENNNTMQSYNEDIIQPPYFESKKLEQKGIIKVSIVLVFIDKTYDLLADPPSTVGGENAVKKIVTTLDVMTRYLNVAEKNKKNLVYQLKVPDLLIKSHVVISVYLDLKT